MTHEHDKPGAELAPTGPAVPATAPTAPAEARRVMPPEPLECVQCRTEIPAHEALVPEGLDYILYFCSPGCHEAWEQARAEQETETQTTETQTTGPTRIEGKSKHADR
ncbi:MAG: DUF3330 domain-containing protein [Chromatiaceae bacterium]|nr:MAG: DUF3330 domain-containing protein [Chromatiaceae bacterium]